MSEEILNVLPGVYLLNAELSSEHKRCLRAFSGKLVGQLESRLERGQATADAVQRGDTRWQVDFAPSLLSLRRQHERVRHCELVVGNLDEANGCMAAIMCLLTTFREGLKKIGVKETEELYYYAYCVYARPNSPAQDVHQDLGFRWGKGYFTALLPLTKEAENTEFLHDCKLIPMPGFVFFDGHVKHRGPANTLARAVLALVASPKEDENSVSNTPFMNRASDWGIISIK